MAKIRTGDLSSQSRSDNHSMHAVGQPLGPSGSQSQLKAGECAVTLRVLAFLA